MDFLDRWQLRGRIEEALRGKNANYIEVRIEEAISRHINFRGREIDELGSVISFGGNVRALVGAGWGFVSFNSLEGLKEKVGLAISYARRISGEKISFFPAEPVEHIEDEPSPISSPLEKARELLEEYNEIIWQNPKITSSLINYADGWKKIVLANTDGSFIEKRRRDFSLMVRAIACWGGDLQQSGFSIGSIDFRQLTGLHSKVKEAAEKAVKLLSAPKVEGGEYTVVVDPVLGGIFAHEAFGHLSEADHIYENEKLREIMVLGRRFGQPWLNIIDDPTLPGLRGSYQYDDEGVRAGKSYLIREGVLVGRLHSRETAAKMGEKPTGNARAMSFAFPPIIRMSNTYIEPGGATFDDLISEIKKGVYAREWYGGQTSMEMFTFSAGEAYMIRNGRIEELMQPVVLTGNVFETLQRIEAIANDLEFNQGGGCGKGIQYPLPVSTGSPHIKISRCLVGGR